MTAKIWPRDLMLGRLPSPLDPRDDHLLRALTFKDWFNALWRRKMVWTPKDCTDQDGTNGCTGFSIANLGFLTPTLNLKEAAAGLAIYRRACELDGNAGRDEGATTRSSLKAAQELGFIKNYAFAHSLDEIEMYVRGRAPVIFASSWYHQMFFPDSKYFIEPRGSDDGGHQYVIFGVDSRDRRHRLWWIESSWSKLWPGSDRGTARMTDAALQFLFQNRGECAAVTEHRV